MNGPSRTSTSFLVRFLVISTFFLSGLTVIAEISAEALTPPATPKSNAEREAAVPSGSTSTYRWNVADAGMPLISLPDHIGGGLDLSLTYPMDQFEFPLFQSLYYSERAGKYILMVIPKTGRSAETVKARGMMDRPAEFINLARREGNREFEANGKLSLRLADKGDVKLLSTSDGTVYTFAALADGEFHCRQINNRYGVVLNLKYTNNASIRSIADAVGRTITFSYTNDYVSSITQTWDADSKKLRKTWAIADDIRFAHRPAHYAAPAGAATGKHIPSNAIKASYTQEMVASDSLLASLFGGPGAIAAANGFEPAGLGHQYPLYRGDLIGDDGRLLRGHLSFAMHLYGNADGSGEMALYVPAGFTSHSDEPSPADAAITFYYPRLGNLANVTLAVFHIKNFQLSYEGERVRIGNIGGPGGSIGSYRHSHLEFYRGNTGLPSPASRVQLRIDPATVFGSTPAKN